MRRFTSRSSSTPLFPALTRVRRGGGGNDDNHLVAHQICSSTRHFTLSRVIAQTWLIILTFTPSSAVAASGSTSTASAAAASSPKVTATAAAAVGGGGGMALYLGLADPTMIMLGCGVLARLTTLPLSLYGDKCLCRLSTAMPELIKAYESYTAIADHPKSIGWERKVARSKLKRDRQRIFGLHGTGSMRTFVPQMIASVLAVYHCLIPAGICSSAAIVTRPLIPIGEVFVGSSATALAAAAASSGSSTVGSVAEAVAMLDGGFALAAGLTTWNLLGVVQRRKGFNDAQDERLELAKKYGTIGMAATVGVVCYAAPVLVAAMAAAVGASTIPTTLLPAYVAPFWVGLAATSAIQRMIHGAAPLRSLFDLQPYPPTHGMYGNASTGSIVDRSGDDASSQIDEYERNEQWRKHKMLLDFECNLKIYKLLKFLRLENHEDDFERQRERLAFRIAAKRSKDGAEEPNEEQTISQSLPKGPKL